MAVQPVQQRPDLQPWEVRVVADWGQPAEACDPMELSPGQVLMRITVHTEEHRASQMYGAGAAVGTVSLVRAPLSRSLTRTIRPRWCFLLNRTPHDVWSSEYDNGSRGGNLGSDRDAGRPGRSACPNIAGAVHVKKKARERKKMQQKTARAAGLRV